MQPHLGHCIQFWAPQYQNRKLLECPKERYVDGEGSMYEDIKGAAEVPWFAQPREEEAEGRPYGGLQLLTEQRCSTEIFCLAIVAGPEETAWNNGRGESGWILGKDSSSEDG